MNAAIWLWARREISRRWPSMVALGVLAGLVGGLAVAAVAGARRTSTAFERYREATGRADAILFGTLLGLAADYTPVRNLPEVEDAGEFTLAPLVVEGHTTMGQLAPNDDRLYRTIARPLLVAGRLPDPARPDEIVVNRHAADRLGLRVGDRVKILSSTALDESVPIGTGPSVDATVVGVGNSALELTFFSEEPGFVPSGALLTQHPEIPRVGNLVVRLRPGTDVAAFGRRAAEVMGLPNLPVRDLAEDTKRVTHGTDLERTALLLFAAAVALAGLVLVGQALSRTVYGLAESALPLRSLGITRVGLVAGLLVPPAAIAVAASAMALAAAVGLSRWFPVGLAGRLEPDPGVHVDWLVLLPGAALVALAVLAGASAAALRATSRAKPRLAVRPWFALAPALVRVAPLPAVIGAELAIRRGDGARALPVRPALVSGITAVLGVVGAFGLLHGIDSALARPEQSGQFWHATVLTSDELPVEDVLAAASGHDEIAETYVMRHTEVEAEGVSLPLFALAPVKGSRTFAVLEGRPPATADEVVLGPATARALNRDVGDTVAIGGAETVQARVVGVGLLPQSPHFSFDQGGWMTVAGFETIAPDGSDGAREGSVAVRFAPGTSVDEGIARLKERLGPTAYVESAALPQDVAFLRNVRTLPAALAVFLVVLGLGALGHVLTTAVKRRRHDLAVLRALGFGPWQVASCVAWQAVTLLVVALALGIPLGIAAGRWSWRWVAEVTPLLYLAPLATAVVVLSVPAGLVLANLMAALPARRAARLRPAEVLRAE